MDRTVPSRGNEEIALYIRTYYSLLRSSRAVNIDTLIEAHLRIESALHINAEEKLPDMAAFIYALLRLPACILNQVQLVVMGQSERVFAENGYPDVEKWISVSAPARRRRCFFDGGNTLATYIASRSDIDDLIPMLTAFQIERNKLHNLLHQPAVLTLLQADASPTLHRATLQQLSVITTIPAEDLHRLRTIWGAEMRANLLAMAAAPVSLAVRSLAASLAAYRRATRLWWQHADATLAHIPFEDRPIYFVSSNNHSLANLVSGYALAIEQDLLAFIAERGSTELRDEYEAIQARAVERSRENFFYYVLKKYERDHPAAAAARLAYERQAGIFRVPSEHVFDVEIQVFVLNQINANTLDPRLRLPGLEALRDSQALIINVDFPLGMGAYQLLSEVSRNIAAVLGVYIMGKAATLNGRIGDVMLPSVVHDEHSSNTYLFRNCLTAEGIAPFLAYGNVLDNQKAITVLGTFLQNKHYMGVFYEEGYTDMEMEAGPYLNCVYEMVRPKRFPQNEIVDLYSCPFPIGIVHYASDTPFSKGKNLGAQNLSYSGIDATYAASVAILSSILGQEIDALVRPGGMHS